MTERERMCVRVCVCAQEVRSLQAQLERIRQQASDTHRPRGTDKTRDEITAKLRALRGGNPAVVVVASGVPAPPAGIPAVPAGSIGGRTTE